MSSLRWSLFALGLLVYTLGEIGLLGGRNHRPSLLRSAEILSAENHSKPTDWSNIAF